MARSFKKFSIVLALFVAAAFLPQLANTARADSNYITLSSYYLLPNQSLMVSGFNFTPNESVTVSVAGASQNVTAGGNGSFTTQGFTIPFSAINSTQAVNASGNMGHSSSANLVVGTFYPNVTPSSWYLQPGGDISFTGTGFAPNEEVKITRSDNPSTGPLSGNTNGSGEFGTGRISIPYMPAGPLTFTFTGQTSRVSRNVTVTVANEPAYLLLSNYYGASGDPLQVRGFAFGRFEEVSVTFQGTSLGKTTTDGSGQFTLNSRVPSSDSGGTKTITATGTSTGKSAQTTFTQSNFSPPQ